MNKDEARQLLGTLSQQADDVQAAYMHQYRSCASELGRADTTAEQTRLEQNLRQLRLAQQVLLQDSSTAEIEEMADHSTPQQAASEQSNALLHFKTATSSTQHILISAMLVVLITFLTAFGGYFVAQSQHFEQLNQQLQQQISQQHQQLENIRLRLTRNLDNQMAERQQWLSVQNQQQQQIQQQHDLIGQQQNISKQLHQQITVASKQLAAERHQTLALQQQVARLNQQSDALIDELCNDSASIGPAIDSSMTSAYLNRCRLLWSLAGG